MQNHYTAVLIYLELVKKQISDSAKFVRYTNAWFNHDAEDFLAATITEHFFDNKSINFHQKIIIIYREINNLNSIYLDKLQALYGVLHTVMQTIKVTLELDYGVKDI